MVDHALNSARIGNDFTKHQKLDGYTHQDVYLCDYIGSMSEYLSSLNLDKRSIATGADAVNWSMFETLPQESSEITIFAKNIGIFMSAILQVAEPQKVLFSSPVVMNNLDLFATIIKNYNPVVHVLNSPFLHLYEKFCKTEEPFASKSYSALSKQELLENAENSYDMIISYSDDLEHDFEFLKAHIPSLSVGGVMLIVNTGNSSVLYGTDDYKATPQAELHEVLKENEDVAVYHISYLIGFTIVKKIK